jgi:hypothetical protein
MTTRRPGMRGVNAALPIAGLAALFAPGCVVRERDGYGGSYGYGHGYERRDDDRDRREARRADDRRANERGSRY